MGMYGTIFQVTPTTLEELKSSPVPFYEISSKLDSRFYIDKDWHRIHFILTGSATRTDSILSKVIMGGKSLTGIEEQAILGEPYYLTPEEVKQIASMLNSISEEEFKARYNPKAMTDANIYLQLMDKLDESDLNEIQTVFKELVDFYAEAAQQENATVIVIE